jgi:acyl-CoA synthetase (AMP-forming)/AMP-acid ligase II
MNLLLAGPPSKTLFAVPLFHISGLFSQAIANLKGGRSLYMMYKWDADDAIRAMRDEGVTILMGAPTMMLDVLKHPELAKIDVSNISNISAAGAATPPSLFKLFREKMPDTMAGAGWGLTETAGTGAAYTGQAFAENPTSSGFVSPIVEMKFINEAGEVITDGSPGEIYIKTAACVDHYDSGGNDEDFPDGWFKTGDVGYKDANGLLYLCDRVKDMIIRGGENIYPVEVENCLITHPNCVEAAVLGIADENYGEKVVAVVVCKDPNTADGESFIAHCKSHLAAYKVPTEIVFSDSALPRNPTKKLLKKQIKQAFFA